MTKVKKVAARKITSKKLEDRIAPGMVGGGLVDPGMVEVIDVDSDSDVAAETVDQTGYEQLDGEDPQEVQYLDSAQDQVDAPLSEILDTDNTEAPQEEFSGNQQYDEFSSQEQIDGDSSAPDDQWQEADWVSANADGSVEITPPEGVVIDADAGIANFPLEVANEELSLPEDVQITADGGLQMPLPEGAEYLQESNQLLIPEGEVSLEEIPEGMDAHVTPEGSIMVNLPDDGVTIDTKAGTIEFDNYWANEFSPENIEINDNGSVEVTLPEEGVEYNEDGTLHLDAEASEILGNPGPEYCTDIDCATYNVDGSVTVDTPDGVSVNGGICEVPCDIANDELPMPEEFELNSDGTSSYSLGEGVEYHESVNGLTFPEGEINLDEVPEGIEAHINPDGTTTVILADGMQYDAEASQVIFDNHWTNEFTPDNCQVDTDGTMNIALPEGTEFYEDGSFNIPSDQIDFATEEVPAYVDDCQWTNCTPEGAYECAPPEGIELNTDDGKLHCQYEMIEENIPIDEEVQFNSDGTMNVTLPEGTTFNAELNQITMPEGEAHIDEIPEQVNPQLNSDGSISVTLQDGMTFDGGTNSIHLDNYWTNELIPEAVEYTQEGELIINLPDDCEFHDDGSFIIAEGSIDFIENPDPGYCTEGPDWVNTNPDGSVTFESNDNFSCHPDEGYIEMNSEYINDAFEDYKPDGLEFHDDGTMTAKVPDGTIYDAESSTLTFATGEMHMDEIPDGVEAQLNEDGTITITLQDGMEFDSETQSVHFDNYWTNVMTPDCVEFNPDGQCHVDMPHDAHFYEDGSVQIPEGSVDFVDSPYPEYVNEGPDWVTDNPDGSVTITTPEGITVNAEEGYLSMSAETAMTELGGDLIPEGIELNPDGTMTMSIPQDFNFDYDAESNSFTVSETPDGFNSNEVPGFIETSIDTDGVLTFQLPEGVSYDADTGTLNISNELVNEMVPEAIEFTTDGEFKINLPEDTQYFEEGFVISADSADFIDDHTHDDFNEVEHAQAA